MIEKIMTIAMYASIHCGDLFPNLLAMFVYIDNMFSDEWLMMLYYLAESSYGPIYYRIIFYASLNRWLSGMRPSKALSGELDDELWLVIEAMDLDETAIEKVWSIIMRN
jgi:hypothetical protein